MTPHLEGIRLRDFRLSDAERILQAVADSKPRAHTTLKNVKSFLSGAFRYAKSKDAIAGANPVRDAKIPRGKKAGDTHAYTLDEVHAILAETPEPYATALLIFALTGLRKSEVMGLKVGRFS